ncbi:nucleotide exchange factor GrpE [Moraxella catarrhalis]|uniref:nucleotide exchange factor GrpE n=2 Tax=Moraxellaceae TaxID=468 RepID=UPI000202A99B|nr:nucleotide exchange factor GrpE [Moraxella catarrhalis]EGE13347.1 GrpE family heat shock protein [Moraxella catarrhalis 12P80B1]MCG6819689.1 nucleotide exchange factor GrpE [Moraxella catarrhalis]MCG6831720.1 nucleotide exchange factor GrpE [Moraxella catarrhalis]MPX46012.1 nucleotide exchange factor GrpE [Moraxella catarrhalis]MPX85876.1 nucleotide exchange factor GrpE [Moraxella catarrhalis]
MFYGYADYLKFLCQSLENFILNHYEDGEFILTFLGQFMTEQTTEQTTMEEIMTEQTTEQTTMEEIMAETTTEQVEALHSQIQALENEVKEAKETAARANAESYNAQRRMEQETDKAKKFALQKFAKELLEVVDNLERAIKDAEETGADDASLEGIRLTHKVLLSVLEKNGVVAVGNVGDTFNPEIHEAVGIFPEAEKDIIGQVLQKGYILNERTLRPAMVMVGA